MAEQLINAAASLPPVAPAASEKDGKAQASESVVRDAAHAVAQLESDAAIAAAKVEEDANKLAKVAGERVAQKWLEERFTEIETKANTGLEELKKWLDARLAQIEGKKPAAEEKLPAAAAAEPAKAPEASAAPAANPPAIPPAQAASNESAKKRFRRI